MVRNQKRPLDDDQLEDIYLSNIGKSEVLRPHVEHYDRCDDDRADHSFQFLGRITDKVIRNQRQRRNTEALVAAAGADTPRKHALPATTPDDGHIASGGDAPTGAKSKGKGGKGDGSNGSPSRGSQTPAADRVCPWHLLGICREAHTVKNGECCKSGLRKQTASNKDKGHPFFLKLKALMEKTDAEAKAAAAATANDIGQTPPTSPRLAATPAGPSQ